MAEKLVRDFIPAIIRSTGVVPLVRQAAPEEMFDLLRRKLLEEATELANAPTLAQQVEELADVMEVVLAMVVAKGVTDYRHLEAVRKMKLSTRGGFEERWVLISDDAPVPPATSAE